MRSLLRSTQPSVQQVRGDAQVIDVAAQTHLPSRHFEVAPQAVRQPPQFMASLLVSMQAPSQHVVSASHGGDALHRHSPPLQVSAFAYEQVMPQPPQFSMSFLTQTSEQHIRSVAQGHPPAPPAPPLPPPPPAWPPWPPRPPPRSATVGVPRAQPVAATPDSSNASVDVSRTGS